ncbi:MAG TPA: glycosyltransferase family 4 protein, partial [Solirubrobacteraceae bacterium]|nr:glycosyltransferase family 4 protein [Solirubrobacteraceae bacterium]
TPVRICLEPQRSPAAFKRRSRPAKTRRRRLRGPVRVLMCSHDLNYTGAPLALVELARHLRAQYPVELEVLSFADGPVRAQFEQLELPVEVRRDDRGWDRIEYERMVSELASWVVSRGIEVALVNTVLAFPAADACTRAGIPVAWAIRESYAPPLLEEVFQFGPAIAGRLAEVLRDTSTLVFVAQATRRLYERYLPTARCLTLRSGIDIDQLDRWRAGIDRAEVRRELNLPGGASPVVLCVGTIAPHKGQVPLIQAFAEIADCHSGAVLVLVGGSGDAHSETARTAAEAFGIADRVRIEPAVADVRPWYAGADVLVSASDVESLPRSMLEAMAMRLPVLGTRVFGVPELISDGHTGWLCEPRDVDALSRALDRVLSLGPGTRAGIARNARAKVERENRSDVDAHNWASLLSQLARG